MGRTGPRAEQTLTTALSESKTHGKLPVDSDLPTAPNKVPLFLAWGTQPRCSLG